jgi:3D (Asp-Asp-Asp) domain-containing protein
VTEAKIRGSNSGEYCIGEMASGIRKKKKKNRRVIAIVPRVAIPCFSQSYSGEEGMERMRDSGLTTLMMD